MRIVTLPLHLLFVFIIAGALQAECDCSHADDAACSPLLLELAEDAIYAPWRDSYKEEAKQKKAQQQACVFCTIPGQERHNFILARYEHCFVLMNIYPYTKGHLLVIPYQHTARLSDLSQEARLEIMNVVALCLDGLKEILHCEGFNVGINIGEIAKASVPDHLHIHVMPRYKVDAGFAHLIGGIKVVAWDLEQLYYLLLPLFRGEL